MTSKPSWRITTIIASPAAHSRLLKRKPLARQRSVCSTTSRSGGAAGSGDVIVQVDQTPVTKPDDIIQKVKDAAKSGKSKSVLLLVNRHGQNRYVALTPDEKNG